MRPPKSGKYVVRLYARRDGDEDSSYAWVTDYSLTAEGYTSPGGFPKNFSTKFRAMLIAPLINPLAVGSKVNFSVKVTGCSKVICMMTSETGKISHVILERRGEDAAGYVLFEGPVSIKTAGKLAVAGCPEGSQSFNFIGEYQLK